MVIVGPQQKRDGMGRFRIYDLDYKPVMEGRPGKMSLRPREYFVTTWPFPLQTLTPGTYRIDLLIDADPVWRTYFRIVD
jgi:hypothetical protein